MSEHILVNDIRVPVQVKRSRRNLVRYSITSKSVNLSVPRYYIKHLIKKELAKFELWCLSQFESKPELLDRFKSRHYFNGQRIDIYGDSFILQIETKTRKTVAAKIQNNEIIISIPFGIEESEKHQSIGKVLSRTLSKYFINDITNRVHQLNNKYLQENIESVKLKNNRSNWGSCSSKRNINLSRQVAFCAKRNN